MGQETPVLDIIVPTHNNIEITINCLKHIYSYTDVPFKVIVIDDSDDLTPTWITQNKEGLPALIYIRPEGENKFISGNQIINEALRHCKSPYVAHLCNSVLVEPEWAIMGFQLIQQPKVGVVGFKLLLPYSGLIEHAGIGLDGQLVPVDIGRGEPAHRHTYIKKRDAVAWSMVMFKREAVEGNLEENHYHGFRGWDDIDNCVVIANKGWDIVYCGAGSGYHYAHYTRMAQNSEDRNKIYENMKTFIKRWPGKIKAEQVEEANRQDILDKRGSPPLSLRIHD